MNRRQLLAAELYHYSYAHYADHLGIGHVRFEEMMPDDVDIMERAERENWNTARLARALEISEDKVPDWIASYQRAKAVIDAPTPAESFRHGVRHSIQDAIDQGLQDQDDIEQLVTQICYRAADLAYLLDLHRERLSTYSRDLRKTTPSDLKSLRADLDQLTE